MASISPCKKGYRAQVYVKGYRSSAVFRTKREAEAWAAENETRLRQLDKMPSASRYTLGDAMRRYKQEETIKKRGARWEGLRIDKILRESGLDDVKLANLTPEMLGIFRDQRLRQVKPASVLREISLISVVLDHARREWRWIATNPCRDIRRPPMPRHRDRVLTRKEIHAMLSVMGYSPRKPVRSLSQAVAVAFLLALRTGMRAGEICNLTWDRVHKDYCVLPVTKTVPRNVPLSDKAQRVIEHIRGFDDRYVIGVSVSSLDALFRKYRQRAGLSGFTFHDSRHTAATWLARQIDVLDLCKMFGWSNTKQALTYYNPSASDIAQRLSSRRK